jgi:hypothetical protein
MVVDDKELRDFARGRGRAAFVTQWAGFFMVVSGNPAELSIGFRTVETKVLADGDGAGPPTFELIHVVKAPGNPYPERISLGRAPNCDIVLRDASVSKLHAHLRSRGLGRPRLELTDLNSSNGTQVNGRKATPNEPMVLALGDTLQFGTVQARLADAAQIFDFLR